MQNQILQVHFSETYPDPTNYTHDMGPDKMNVRSHLAYTRNDVFAGWLCNTHQPASFHYYNGTISDNQLSENKDCPFYKSFKISVDEKEEKERRKKISEKLAGFKKNVHGIELVKKIVDEYSVNERDIIADYLIEQGKKEREANKQKTALKFSVDFDKILESYPPESREELKRVMREKLNTQ
jgi:hypothetical protein